MTIDNISILEYFTRGDTLEYDVLLNHMNPENKLCGRACITNNITFDEFEVMKKIFSNPNLESMQELYIHLFNIKGSMRKSEKEIFLNESIFQLFRATNFIKQWLTEKIKKESEWLGGDENEVLSMLNAGKRLAPFSHQLRKVDIGKMFGVTPDEVGRWKYSRVFSILVSVQVRSEIQKEYNEIQ